MAKKERFSINVSCATEESKEELRKLFGDLKVGDDTMEYVLKKALDITTYVNKAKPIQDLTDYEIEQIETGVKFIAGEFDVTKIAGLVRDRVYNASFGSEEYSEVLMNISEKLLMQANFISDELNEKVRMRMTEKMVARILNSIKTNTNWMLDVIFDGDCGFIKGSIHSAMADNPDDFLANEEHFEIHDNYNCAMMKVPGSIVSICKSKITSLLNSYSSDIFLSTYHHVMRNDMMFEVTFVVGKRSRKLFGRETYKIEATDITSVSVTMRGV